METENTYISESEINGPQVDGKEIMEALMTMEKPSEYFEFLKENYPELLKEKLPELHALIGCEQSPVHHPEGDAWVHTMQVIDAAAKRREEAQSRETFMLAALCHDLGKPATTKVTEKGIQSIGHETAGIEPANNMLKRLNTNEKSIDSIDKLIQCHMQPRSNWQQQTKQKTFNKMFKRVNEPSDLVLMSLADNAGKEFASELEAALKEAFNGYLESKETELAGNRDDREVAIYGGIYGQTLVLQDVETGQRYKAMPTNDQKDEYLIKDENNSSSLVHLKSPSAEKYMVHKNHKPTVPLPVYKRLKDRLEELDTRLSEIIEKSEKLFDFMSNPEYLAIQEEKEEILNTLNPKSDSVKSKTEPIR